MNFLGFEEQTVQLHLNAFTPPRFQNAAAEPPTLLFLFFIFAFSSNRTSTYVTISKLSAHLSKPRFFCTQLPPAFNAHPHFLLTSVTFVIFFPIPSHCGSAETSDGLRRSHDHLAKACFVAVTTFMPSSKGSRAVRSWGGGSSRPTGLLPGGSASDRPGRPLLSEALKNKKGANEKQRTGLEVASPLHCSPLIPSWSRGLTVSREHRRQIFIYLFIHLLVDQYLGWRAAESPAVEQTADGCAEVPDARLTSVKSHDLVEQLSLWLIIGENVERTAHLALCLLRPAVQEVNPCAEVWPLWPHTGVVAILKSEENTLSGACMHSEGVSILIL